MLHWLYRFACASLSFLGVVALFAAWGVLAALMSGTWEIFGIAALFAAIFFGPAAFVRTWEDVGD